MAVLGLVTTKSPRLESASELKDRVGEAASLIDLERLALSPQCGFASSIVGNALEEVDQTAKLRRIAEVASEIWS